MTAKYSDRKRISVGKYNSKDKKQEETPLKKSSLINKNTQASCIAKNDATSQQEETPLKKSTVTCEKNTQTRCILKKDATTQFDNRDLELNKRLRMEDKQLTSNNITKELIGTFLNQLISQRQQNTLVENSTNTDETKCTEKIKEDNLQEAQSQTNVQLKKTSDLLDSLEKALSEDNGQNLKNPNIIKGNCIPSGTKKIDLASLHCKYN